MRLATLGLAAILGCHPGRVPALTPQDIEQLDCARALLVDAGFSVSSVRPSHLSGRRQASFDTWDGVSVWATTADTACAPLNVSAGQSVEGPDGKLRAYYGFDQSLAASDFQNAILQRCGCTKITHDSSATGDPDQ
jgi:hypothetical protein